MRVAIVHDWLVGVRGGERCLRAFLKIFPNADIFTLFHKPRTTHALIDSRVKKTSFLNKLPGSHRYYRVLLPLYPAAVSKFSFDGYDLVISLSHAAAKNITVPKGTLHLCYCFTPMRYIWDQSRSYLGRLRYPAWPLVMALRRWDRNGSKRVSCMVAISRFVAARIRRFYGIHARVIYPPVDLSWIEPVGEGISGEAFLYAGALVPYKRVDLAIKAFNKLGEKLWVVGSGPEEEKLKAIAGPNIQFFGRVSDEELAEYYRRSRALIFPGTEDFGLIPVECLAAGRPVIGAYAGGLKETLNGLKPWEFSGFNIYGATGVFFRTGRGDDVQELINSISYFIAREEQFSSTACAARAKCFSAENFYQSLDSLITELVGERSMPPNTEVRGDVQEQIEEVINA